jgi:ABC-type transport system involved in cytochrome c biogenesis permease subunit
MKNAFPWLAAALLAGGLLWPLARGPRRGDGFDLESFARLPALHRGRIKPIDTIARGSLLMLHGKQTLRQERGVLSAVEWMLEFSAKPEQADARKLFRIDDPDVLGMMGIAREGSPYFSFDDLRPHLQEIRSQAMASHGKERAMQSRFERAVGRLDQSVGLYQGLKNTLQPEGTEDFPSEVGQYEQAIGRMKMEDLPAGEGAGRQAALQTLHDFLDRWSGLSAGAVFAPFPPREAGRPADEWLTVGEALSLRLHQPVPHPLLFSYAGMLKAYRNGDAASFNGHLAVCIGHLGAEQPGVVARARREALFNRSEPFYRASLLYVFAGLCAFLSWLFWPQVLGRSAYYGLILAFAAHTAGMGMRMYLEDRPPVTNLYSSAVFVGWGAVAIGIVLERSFRLGIGSAVASAIGFVTLLVAHHLSLEQGDTMEMMRAVLDSNFWLATHVITITIGYSSTYLAGFLALVYILRGVLTASLDAGAARSIVRMIYGVVCFSLLFSFVGTVLGGIWADQSWGRFWGWDPKENGALLLVLWNALILHARWGGFVRERGLVCMAAFGNIVTSWSWFGVNMLGVGLHSYGFMDKAFVYLAGFCAANGLCIAAGLLPTAYWRSFRKMEAA